MRLCVFSDVSAASSTSTGDFAPPARIASQICSVPKMTFPALTQSPSEERSFPSVFVLPFASFMFGELCLHSVVDLIGHRALKTSVYAARFSRFL